MKKIYLAVFLACSIGGAVHAQISEGGLPWSVSRSSEGTDIQKVSKATFAEPNYAEYLKEDEEDARLGRAKPYRAAATVASDIDIVNAGTWTYLSDGSMIWRLDVEIPGAVALGLYYDKFNLPKGVSVFVTNANGRQILGAFTSNNNSEYDIFSSEEVQGEVSRIEINVASGVSVDDIKFHINKIYAFYRGVNEVNIFASDKTTAAKPTIGESATCHINSVCAPGNETIFKKSTNAVVRISGGGGFCTGTLINNTSNTAGGACRQFMLTASHCDGENSRENSHFAGHEFRFNYQYVDCEGQGAVNFQTRTGASFRARSNYPSMPTPENALVADFMLLELTTAPPANADAYLAGWNRDPGIWSNEDYDRYLGFHHPSGDVKKLSVGNSMEGSGNFNQSAVPNTHWNISFQTGGISKGSSGSGLFDKDGLLIGDLSGSGPGECEGKDYSTSGLYSKISYAWDNFYDQNAFPAFAGAPSRLKDWLDPAGSAPMALGAAKYDCSDVSAISELDNILNSAINVYPNPSTTGKVNFKANFTEPTSLQITVVNLSGAVVKSFAIRNALSGNFALDMSELANGMYLIKFATSGATTSKKVLLNK